MVSLVTPDLRAALKPLSVTSSTTVIPARGFPPTVTRPVIDPVPGFCGVGVVCRLVPVAENTNSARKMVPYWRMLISPPFFTDTTIELAKGNGRIRLEGFQQVSTLSTPTFVPSGAALWIHASACLSPQAESL
ncbi:MAG: hypothetical protein ABI882_10035, partial [Acidobacteriota bacterium]